MSIRTIVAILASIAILAVLTIGFLVAGSPQQARLSRQDQQRVDELRQITYAIGSFTQQKGRLPVDFLELTTTPNGYGIPSTKDPFTGKDYAYRVLNEEEYELCAEFWTVSNGASVGPRPFDDRRWEHGTGRTCFIFGKIDMSGRPLEKTMLPLRAD